MITNSTRASSDASAMIDLPLISGVDGSGGYESMEYQTK